MLLILIVMQLRSVQYREVFWVLVIDSDVGWFFLADEIVLTPVRRSLRAPSVSTPLTTVSTPVCPSTDTQSLQVTVEEQLRLTPTAAEPASEKAEVSGLIPDFIPSFVQVKVPYSQDQLLRLS